MIQIKNIKWYDQSANMKSPQREEGIVKELADFFKENKYEADIKVVTTKVVMRQYVRAIRVKNKPNRMVSFKGRDK